MEGMRGFAVLLVFLAHYHALFGSALPPQSLAYTISHFLGAIGHAGVDLFFVLSGYLIYSMLLLKPVGYWRFWRRRVQRIYPAFFAVFAVYVLLGFLVPARAEMAAGPVATAIYLLQNAVLMPGLFEITPLITVAWSLSYEMLFYCILPILVTACRMRTWPPAARCGFFLSAGLLYAALHLTCATYGIPWLRLLPAAHPRLCMFVAGILVFEAQHSLLKGRMSRAGEFRALGGLLAGFVLYYLLRTNQWMVAHLRTAILGVVVLSFGFFGPVLYGFVFPGFLQRAFSWTALRWLGNMSYSYYLVHGLALHGLNWLLSRIGLRMDSILFHAGLLPAAMLVTLASATVLFLLVEKPLSLQRPSRFCQTAMPYR